LEYRVSTATNNRPIDTSRKMQEWVLPKGDTHTFMQAYVGETHSTVVFFTRERASAIRVPFFEDRCSDLQDDGFVVFYHRVSNADITAYLTDVHTVKGN
jgi:hypothetical protein